MATATLTSKGQTTIPKEVRDHLHVSPGDKLDFLIDAEGRVVVRPATLDVRQLKGMLKRKRVKPVSLEEMDRAIAEGAARKRA
ncbi:SpoVT-AbrB domain-containing protein [Nitrospira tepida]|uniref:SpoVT-AbrB domain-containing protein n=1 Tax=Nitrospira tepida TaxID=2973512 RepID=A0AA86MWS9_9BACT|nr:AbrB/MazE/SpoVT family DNA-binding domain-containing protein [Nitrospira tepida]CAI4030447.1 SpoVT-AbrB domain-containing protein [Nitrospira tepida]